MFIRTQWVFTLTQWCSCALNECSEGVQYSLIGIHVHSMGVQGLFPLTHCCLVFIRTQCVYWGCSHSLKGIHGHSLAFRVCSILTQKAFSLFISKKAQWICFQICQVREGPINLLSISVECLFFGFAKQEDLTSHLNTCLVGGLGVCQ